MPPERAQEQTTLPSLVVVPRRPGPLIVPPSSSAGARDEVDVALDDLFGPPLQQKPGPLDVALLVGGAALTVYAELVLGGGGLLVAGLVCIALGMVLPARSIWRRAQRARSGRRLAAILNQGQPLNLTDGHTRRLAQSYSRIERIASGSNDPSASEAAEAALEALREVAGLLRGRPPSGVAESEYVARRTAAVEGLDRSLLRAGAAGAADTETARDAVVEALSQFEERSGMSSLDRIAGLRAANRRSTHREPPTT